MINSKIFIREIGWKDVEESPAHIAYVSQVNPDNLLIPLTLVLIEWASEKESPYIYVNKNDIICIKKIEKK